MAEAHHHPHDHHGHDHGAPDVPLPPARVDTLLASAGSRLVGVAVVCAVMWAALWLAVRAG